MAASLQHCPTAQQPRLSTTRPGSGGTAIAGLRFRFAPPAPGNGGGDDNALTIYPDHPVGAAHQLRTHLADFMAAYNFARRLKTLSGLTPYEYIAKIWTSEPDRFIVDPIHQMPGLNT